MTAESNVIDAAAAHLRDGVWTTVLALYSELDFNTAKGPFASPSDLHWWLSQDDRFHIMSFAPGVACVRLRDRPLARAMVAELRYSVDGWMQVSALRSLVSERLKRQVTLQEITQEIPTEPLRVQSSLWHDGQVWARATYKYDHRGRKR